MRRRLGIDSDAGPGEIELRQRIRDAPACRLLERRAAARWPPRRNWAAASPPPGMEMPDQCGSLGVARPIGGAPQPGPSSGDEIALDPHARAAAPDPQRDCPCRMPFSAGDAGKLCRGLRGRRCDARSRAPSSLPARRWRCPGRRRRPCGFQSLPGVGPLRRAPYAATPGRARGEPLRTSRGSPSADTTAPPAANRAARRRAEGQDVSERAPAPWRSRPRPPALPSTHCRVVIRLGRVDSEKRATRWNRRTLSRTPTPCAQSAASASLRVGVPALRRPLQPAHQPRCGFAELPDHRGSSGPPGTAPRWSRDARPARQVTKPLGARFPAA